jgi:hypothetical protein
MASLSKGNGRNAVGVAASLLSTSCITAESDRTVPDDLDASSASPMSFMVLGEYRPAAL